MKKGDWISRACKMTIMNWDTYWQGNNRPVFNFLSRLYRKYIIRPALNHYITRYFKPGSLLLHAGCGSGECDRDIVREMKITALDMSKAALGIVQKSGIGYHNLLHSSIFDFGNKGNYDGIYNLGAMEHFSREEIIAALGVFKNLLVPGGKAILFWPPEYGFTVFIFSRLERAIRFLSGKPFLFFPEEISRLKSRDEAEELAKTGGFTLHAYHVSIRDLFTYAVVVLEKDSL